MVNSLKDLTIDKFRPLVGTRFRIRPRPERTIDAELLDARALGGAARSRAGESRRRAPFSLAFRTTLSAALPQCIYRVEHDELGVYDIFLVPIGPDEVGMVYEAIFT